MLLSLASLFSFPLTVSRFLYARYLSIWMTLATGTVGVGQFLGGLAWIFVLHFVALFIRGPQPPHNHSLHKPHQTPQSHYLHKHRVESCRDAEERFRFFGSPKEFGNLKRSRLYRLPPHVVSQIVENLSPAHVVCLRYTCRRFYYRHYRADTLSDPEIWELMSLLERDVDKSKARKLLCGPCRKYHVKTEFQPLDWTKDARQRQCSPPKRPFLQVCPYTSLDFNDMQEIKSWMKSHHGEPWPCGHEACNVAQKVGKIGQSTTLSVVNNTYVLFSNHLIWSGFFKHPLSVDHIKDGLSRHNVQICPHIRLGDIRITGTYLPNCLYDNHPQTNPCHRCNQCNVFRCPACATFLTLHVTATKTSTTMHQSVVARVKRILGRVDREDDPFWKSQLSVVKQPHFRENWLDKIIQVLEASISSDQFALDKISQEEGSEALTSAEEACSKLASQLCLVLAEKAGFTTDPDLIPKRQESDFDAWEKQFYNYMKALRAQMPTASLGYTPEPRDFRWRAKFFGQVMDDGRVVSSDPFRSSPMPPTISPNEASFTGNLSQPLWKGDNVPGPFRWRWHGYNSDGDLIHDPFYDPKAPPIMPNSSTGLESRELEPFQPWSVPRPQDPRLRPTIFYSISL